jgi:hypothetical protein
MNRSAFLFFAAFALLWIQACTGGENPGPRGQANELSPAAREAAAVAISSPEGIFANTNSAVEVAARAVYLATVQNGNTTLTTTGTLTVNGNQVTYSANPADRLRLQGANGESYDFFIDQMQGNLSGDDQTFLRNNHAFQFRLTRANGTDAAFTSTLNGNNRSLGVDGQLAIDGTTYTVAVQVAGPYSFQVDNSGSELYIDATYTGTISDGNVQVTVDENWDYEQVFATGGFVAENARRSFNTRWTVDGVTYRYRDGYLQSVFRDGRPTEWDVNNSPWQARGELLRDNQPIGNLEMGQEGGEIKVWLNFEGERIETHSWRL